MGQRTQSQVRRCGTAVGFDLLRDSGFPGARGAAVEFDLLRDSGFPGVAEQRLGLVGCRTADFEVVGSSDWVWSAAGQQILR
jgi:hypothetical protein